MWHIQSNFEVSVSELYRSIWSVVNAINLKFHIDLDITDIDRLKQLEIRVAEKPRRNAISGAVGALDGLFIWQKNPGVAVHNPNRYYCARKEKFSILLMAICDAKDVSHGSK